MNPAVLRVCDHDHFVERMDALPVGRGIGSVQGCGIVEARVATGHEIAVVIGDVAARIGVYRVVRGVGADFHDFVKTVEIVLTRSQPGLSHRAVVAPVKREGPALERITVAVLQGYAGHLQRF